MLKTCEETLETLKEPVYVRDVHNSKDLAPSLSRNDLWLNCHMVSLPATERLQDLLDPILGQQLVRLVLWNQDQKLYRNFTATVGLCRCAPVDMYNSIMRLSPPTPVSHEPVKPGFSALNLTGSQ